jgi:hypothetical protein
MDQSLNAMDQFPILGQMDLLSTHTNAQEAQFQITGTGTLEAGQGVVLVATSRGLPMVLPSTADTSALWGFATFTGKRPTYEPGDMLTVARPGGVIFLRAGGAISAGSLCEYKPSDGTVITSAGTNPVCGRALDAATAGQLFRLEVL